MADTLENKLTIKKADDSDKPILARLLQEQENEFNHEQGSAPVDYEWGLILAEDYLPGTIFLGQLSDNTVGYARVSPANEELEILDLYVAPHEKKIEIEIAMVERLSEFAKSKSLNRIFSVVSRHCKEEQKVYTSLGFSSYQPTNMNSDVYQLYFKD